MSLFGLQRDLRRRRTLAEDRSADLTPAVAAAPSSRPAKAQRYTAAGRSDARRRTTDFVPRSGWSLALWYLAGLTAVAGMLAGFASMGEIAAAGMPAAARLLDAGQGASLAGWFSSLLLLACAAGSVLVYSVRRHRLDDYRGRYRLWLWCAAAWLCMGIDATANLHAPLAEAMQKLSGWPQQGDNAIWWIGIWGVLLAVLALRLLVEVRGCRTATAGVVLTTALWLAALAIEFGWIPRGEHAAIAAAGCRLAGQATLLLVVMAYARHTLLDAEGMLPVREAKPKKAKAEKKPKRAAADPTAGQTTETDSRTKAVPSHRTAAMRTDLQPHIPTASTQRGPDDDDRPQRRGSSFPVNRSSTIEDEQDEAGYADSSHDRLAPEYDEDGEDDWGSARKLTRAERKRLRKQKKKQQRAA